MDANAKAQLEKLRALIETQAEMAVTLIDRALAFDDDDDELSCPECGEMDPERLKDTTEMGGEPRTTCLKCGSSFMTEGMVEKHG